MKIPPPIFGEERDTETPILGEEEGRCLKLGEEEGGVMLNILIFSIRTK